eukprot:3338218-Alexandrium_andersonii.AAC.1
MLGPSWPLELLIYADDLEALGAERRGRVACFLALILLACLGFPVQKAKTHGGLRVDWLGARRDYAQKMMGLSCGRAQWLADWCDDAVCQGTRPALRVPVQVGPPRLRLDGPPVGKASPGTSVRLGGRELEGRPPP